MRSCLPLTEELVFDESEKENAIAILRKNPMKTKRMFGIMREFANEDAMPYEELYDKDIMVLSDENNNPTAVLMRKLCVTKGCGCSKVYIDLVKPDQSTSFSVLYDYKKEEVITKDEKKRASFDNIKEVLPETFFVETAEAHHQARLDVTVFEEMNEEGKLKAFLTDLQAIQSIGRNDPCHCGSGKKYKKCCWRK